MSDHYHYEYAEARHDHRGEYADERHDHDLDYADKHHRHYDDERAAGELRRELCELSTKLSAALDELRDAQERIRVLEDRQPDYAGPGPEADEDQDDEPAAAAECGCPKANSMIRHQRATCTDPIVARLDWYSDDAPEASPDEPMRLWRLDPVVCGYAYAIDGIVRYCILEPLGHDGDHVDDAGNVLPEEDHGEGDPEASQP